MGDKVGDTVGDAVLVGERVGDAVGARGMAVGESGDGLIEGEEAMADEMREDVGGAGPWVGVAGED